MLGVVVTLVAVGAIFAIHESTTEEPFRLQPTPPGLVEQRDPNSPDGAIPTTIIRNDVARPAGLAANPLELSAVMSLAAPFAVFLALSSRRWLARLWFLGCSLLIGLGVVLSISRTGVLASAVMLLVALLANIRRPRVVLSGWLAVAALGFTVAKLVPQSVESLTEQLTKDGNSDPSLATRLEDYQELDDLLGPHPWLGRGPQAITTYVSRDGTQMILDNQYLLSIAETGVIGLAAMVVVILSTASTAADAPDPQRRRERGLFTAVLCATVAFAVMAATFDVLRFSQASALFMIVDRARRRQADTSAQRAVRSPTRLRVAGMIDDPGPRRVRHPPVLGRRAARRLAAGPCPGPPPSCAVGRSAGRPRSRRCRGVASRSMFSSRPVPAATASSSEARRADRATGAAARRGRRAPRHRPGEPLDTPARHAASRRHLLRSPAGRPARAAPAAPRGVAEGP